MEPHAETAPVAVLVEQRESEGQTSVTAQALAAD